MCSFFLFLCTYIGLKYTINWVIFSWNLLLSFVSLSKWQWLVSSLHIVPSSLIKVYIKLYSTKYLFFLVLRVLRYIDWQNHLSMTIFRLSFLAFQPERIYYSWTPEFWMLEGGQGLSHILEQNSHYGQLFSSSCGELQPSAANSGALRAHFLQDFRQIFLGNLVWEFFFWNFSIVNFFSDFFCSGNFFWDIFFQNSF